MDYVEIVYYEHDLYVMLWLVLWHFDAMMMWLWHVNRLWNVYGICVMGYETDMLAKEP